jgi:hypothetical protein
MAWVKVPPENHAPFLAALPSDPSVETAKMFGGVAAKVNGHIFAGLFGLSTMLLLSEADRTKALALDGAAPFDPMGDGRVRSDKVMLPPSMMKNAKALAAWIARAHAFALGLPPKAAKAAKGARTKTNTKTARPSAKKRSTAPSPKKVTSKRA